MGRKAKISRKTAEHVWAVCEKHAKTIHIDFLLDLTRALGLTLHVEAVNKAGEQGGANGEG